MHFHLQVHVQFLLWLRPQLLQPEKEFLGHLRFHVSGLHCYQDEEKPAVKDSGHRGDKECSRHESFICRPSPRLACREASLWQVR
eukprot:2798679-Amphidinium_carterae.1